MSRHVLALAPFVLAAFVLAAACGDEREVEVLAVEESNLEALALAGDAIYWTASVGGEANHTGRIMTVPTSGGVPSTLASGQFNPRWLVVEGDSLFWINHGDAVS